MAQSQYWRKLNLPQNPLQRGFVLPRATARNHYRLFEPGDILSSKVIGLLREAGLTVKTVALFYKRPGSHGIIHSDVALIDGKWRRNIAAINWNLSGANSVMRWYAIAGKGTAPEVAPAQKVEPWYFSLNGIHFGFFGARDRKNLPKSKVRLLAAASIESATLVRTDVPHAVENTDPVKGRWALSVRCDPDFRNWRQAIAAFGPVLEESRGR